jgi:large subunit ribosomal protein L18
MDKKTSRLRRARPTRFKIAELGVSRLAVHRTNLHIYATIVSGDGTKVLASASTLEPEVIKALEGKTGKGGNANAAVLASIRLLSTAQGSVITAASKRWPKPRVKPA